LFLSKSDAIKVFIRPLRTMSLCNCYLLCVYSTVCNFCLSFSIVGE